MSRIGNAPIELPQGVEINVDSSNVVSVKGPKGELKQQIDPDLAVRIEDGVLEVIRPTEQKRHKAEMDETPLDVMVEKVKVDKTKAKN